MKRCMQFSAVILLMVLFAACDMARYPIDSTPSVKIDPRLIGTWKMKGKHEEYTLMKQTDYTYLILYKDQKRSDLEKYQAYFSMIDSVRFLNVYSQDDLSSGYFFLKIININKLRNEVAIVSVSDSTLKDITEPAGVRERITQNLNNRAFYSDTGYFYRVR